MSKSVCVSFAQGYDLEGRIDAFLARRSSALAAGNPAHPATVRVELVGVPANDRRLAALRAAAGPMRLSIVSVEAPRQAV